MVVLSVHNIKVYCPSIEYINWETDSQPIIYYYYPREQDYDVREKSELNQQIFKYVLWVLGMTCFSSLAIWNWNEVMFLSSISQEITIMENSERSIMSSGFTICIKVSHIAIFIRVINKVCHKIHLSSISWEIFVYLATCPSLLSIVYHIIQHKYPNILHGRDGIANNMLPIIPNAIISIVILLGVTLCFMNHTEKDPTKISTWEIIC